jgi:hypothetical protein
VVSDWVRDGHAVVAVFDTDQITVRWECPNSTPNGDVAWDDLPHCRRNWTENGQPDYEDPKMDCCNIEVWVTADSLWDCIDIEVTRGQRIPVHPMTVVGYRWEGECYLWAPSAAIDAWEPATHPVVAAPSPVVPDSEDEVQPLGVPVRVFNRRPDGRPKGYKATKEVIAAQGWTWFVLSDFGDRVDFLWICPGCGGGAAGTLGNQPRGGWDEPRWVMDGAPGKPTLTPSLGCPRWRDGTCPGHYWLRDGQLVQA